MISYVVAYCVDKIQGRNLMFSIFNRTVLSSAYVEVLYLKIAKVANDYMNKPVTVICFKS